MPKKRKTRKEKLLADNKRQVVEEITPSVESSSHSHSHATTAPGVTFSLPATEEHKKAPVQETKVRIESIAIVTNEYGYLKTDLMKTAVITTAIVVAEVVIRFLFLH